MVPNESRTRANLVLVQRRLVAAHEAGAGDEAEKDLGIWSLEEGQPLGVVKRWSSAIGQGGVSTRPLRKLLVSLGDQQARWLRKVTGGA